MEAKVPLGGQRQARGINPLANPGRFTESAGMNGLGSMEDREASQAYIRISNQPPTTHLTVN